MFYGFIIMLASNLMMMCLFLQPMIALATNCWKKDWDDLEKNQQLFKALCYKLVEKVRFSLKRLLNFFPIL